MHILVTAASKHGATDEVADAIAKRIEASGITVDRLAPADVTSVEGYDAVIVLPVGQVCAFSVGMNGVPKHSEQDGTRVGPLLTHVRCRELHTFPGRYKPSLLSLRERSVARLAGVVEGDFRDWDAVDQWADEIVEALQG